MKEISNKSNTLYLLNKYNVKATKKYGQNFIIDPNTIRKIVNYTNVDSDTCVIEIGPGIGALTEYLASISKHVICFEIDNRLENLLYESLSDFNNIEIIFEDILKVDLDNVVNSLNDYSKICIVTNIPYYITSNIIEKVICLNNISSFTMMIQKEVANKLINDITPLGLMIKSRGNIEYCFSVSRNVFMPSPRVDSAIVRIDFNKPFNNNLYNIINLSFKQKRKTIYNNIKDVFEKPIEILSKCNIDPVKRPQELSLDDYIALSKYLEENYEN